MKRNFRCNGKVQKEDHIIQLQGDHRHIAKEFMVDMNIVAEKEDIVIHGT